MHTFDRLCIPADDPCAPPRPCERPSMLSALRHRCSVLAAVVAVLVLLAACGGGGAAAGTPVPDGELRIAAQFAPRSGYAIDTDDAFILTQLGATEALTSASADGQARPALAESWTQVDPLTW